MTTRCRRAPVKQAVPQVHLYYDVVSTGGYNLVVPKATSPKNLPLSSDLYTNVLKVAQDMFRFQMFVKDHTKFLDARYLNYCLKKFCKFIILQSECGPDIKLVPTPAIDICFQSLAIRPEKFAQLPSHIGGHSICWANRMDLGVGFGPHTSSGVLAATAERWSTRWNESYTDLSDLEAEALASAIDMKNLSLEDKKLVKFLSGKCSMPSIELLRDDQVMYEGFQLTEADFFLITREEYKRTLSPFIWHAGPLGILIEYAQDAPSIQLVAAYQRFLKWLWVACSLVNTPEDFVPDGLTDFVWHAHMLQPNKYAVFSKLLGGSKLALLHDPCPENKIASEQTIGDTEFKKLFFHSLHSHLSIEVKQLRTVGLGHGCSQPLHIALPPFSSNLVCNYCEMPIAGPRWTCAPCDFDLCFACSPNQHPAHPCDRPLAFNIHDSKICDGCERKITLAAISCKDCDWDLCKDCAARLCDGARRR